MILTLKALQLLEPPHGRMLQLKTPIHLKKGETHVLVAPCLASEQGLFDALTGLLPNPNHISGTLLSQKGPDTPVEDLFSCNLTKRIKMGQFNMMPLARAVPPGIKVMDYFFKLERLLHPDRDPDDFEPFLMRLREGFSMLEIKKEVVHKCYDIEQMTTETILKLELLEWYLAEPEFVLIESCPAQDITIYANALGLSKIPMLILAHDMKLAQTWQAPWTTLEWEPLYV